MSRRDAYNDYVTRGDVVDFGPNAVLEMERALKERSGFLSSPSAIYRTDHDIASDVLRAKVVFDSRKWTGLP